MFNNYLPFVHTDLHFSFSFKVQISRLQPAEHEKETLEKLSDSTAEGKPRRKRKRPGGPNPLSVLKSKRKKGDKHSAVDDTKVESRFVCPIPKRIW